MKHFIAIIALFLLTQNNSFAAGNDSANEVVKPSSYSKMLKLIKNEQYAEAVQGLEKILENKKYNKDADILNHYAFALRKTNNLTKQKSSIKKHYLLTLLTEELLNILENFMSIPKEWIWQMRL